MRLCNRRRNLILGDTKLPLQYLLDVLRALGEDGQTYSTFLSFPSSDDDVEMSVDMDEVECIVATLIYRRLIKGACNRRRHDTRVTFSLFFVGYISHQLHTLVLSANNAFPRVEVAPQE